MRAASNSLRPTPEAIDRIDAWLDFLGRGHTAGESRLIEGMGADGGPRLLAGHPPEAPGSAAGAPGAALRARISGIVVFDGGGC